MKCVDWEFNTIICVEVVTISYEVLMIISSFITDTKWTTKEDKRETIVR